jgi:hypothetical protein
MRTSRLPSTLLGDASRSLRTLIDGLCRVTDRVPHTLVVDARYIERVTMCARFDLEVASWLLSSRLNLDRLCHLMLAYVAGRPHAKREGLAVRRILR